MNVSSSPTATIVSVITPCFNAERFIAETIMSVIGNSVFRRGQASLEYIVCDGGSTDRTCEIVEEIVRSDLPDNVTLTLMSEPDSGMYDALSKGLRKASGHICAYINAGDFYSPTAFEIVLEILGRSEVRWLTGLQVCYNEQSHMLSAFLPFKFRREFCQCGIYGRLLPFIQQESTFWNSSLNKLIDLERLSSFRYAGDYFLWQTFAKQEILYIVEAWLGGFKVHGNQLSENTAAYQAEVDSIARRPSIGERLLSHLDMIVWHSPNRIKRFLNRDSLFSFDFSAQRYRPNVSNF